MTILRPTPFKPGSKLNYDDEWLELHALSVGERMVQCKCNKAGLENQGEKEAISTSLKVEVKRNLLSVNFTQ